MKNTFLLIQKRFSTTIYSQVQVFDNLYYDYNRLLAAVEVGRAKFGARRVEYGERKEQKRTVLNNLPTGTFFGII